MHVQHTYAGAPGNHRVVLGPLELKEQPAVSGYVGTNLGPRQEQAELVMLEPWLQLPRVPVLILQLSVRNWFLLLFGLPMSRNQ